MSAKILVADESPTIHKIVAMAFEEEGITVEGISRGEHVMEYMVEYQPNIVLADIHLPGIDGYELCRQIKNFSAFEGVQVILLTSDFEDIDELKLEVSQADDFISKPFKTEEILKKVKTQLSIPPSQTKAPETNPEPPQEPESNEVIQNEFEDIINSNGDSTSDPMEQFFEDEDSQPSIDEMDLENDAPADPNNEDSQGELTVDEILPEIMVDDAIRAETHPVQVETDDLRSAFQAVLSSPEPGREDSQKPEPGTKPNLIEETLTLMAYRQSAGTTDGTDLSTRSPSDPTLSDKIIKAHIDQVIDRLPEDATQENLPSTLEKTVREVLGEIAPKIIREVIQEEIETIKKMKEA